MNSTKLHNNESTHKGTINTSGLMMSVNDLSKKYRNGKYGIKNYSLSISNGILGLLGPNGAGKTTLMKIIATISKPTAGNVLLNGIDITKEPNSMRSVLGYLPQDFGVYPNLNAIEFLTYIAAMKGIGGSKLRERIEQLLEYVNLIDVAKNRIGTYSGGMKQRIGIAQALLNDPKVLIFDEPTVGLDPEERVRFRHLITDLATNCIIMLSSHIVSDIETIADEVAVMKDGVLVTHGFQSDIIEVVQGKVFETEMAYSALADFKSNHLVVNTLRRKDMVIVRFITDTDSINAAAMPATLEDAYLYLVKER